MAKQKFGLGRGLDALISGASEIRTPQPSVQPGSEADGLPFVAVDSIIPNPRQPRRAFLEDDPKLLDLSASIKEHGLLQPIVVTRLNQAPKAISASSWFGDEEPASIEPAATTPPVEYQIIAGERRWRAARLAGLSKVMVVIKEVTPQQMLELALIENIQRADLNPIEEALAYQSLIQEFGLTQEALAKRVGKGRTTITNMLGLLKLAPKVREMLMNQSESFTEGHARPLGGLTEKEQIILMNQIVEERLSVRQVEDLIKDLKEQKPASPANQSKAPKLRLSPELNELETHFREALMVKVKLKCNKEGEGTLVLHFNDQEELERLYHRLVKQEEL